MSRRFGVVFNPRAGPTTRSVADVEALLRSAGLDATVVVPSTPAETAMLARELAEDHSVVVAAGGDGSVSAISTALVGTSAALGILPLGTLNHFAQDLGIPLDPAAAVRVLAEGERTSIDTGLVNGRTFVNNVSLGVYPAFVAERDVRREKGRVRRWWTTARAALTIAWRFPLLRAMITIDGRSLERLTPLVFIGNNHYTVEGVDAGRRESLCKGCLCLVTTRERGPLGLLRVILRARLGTLRPGKDLEVYSGRRIEVRTKRARVHLTAIDGEVKELEPPVSVTVMPATLAVIAPRPPRPE